MTQPLFGTDNWKISEKTPEEKPVRHHGGNMASADLLWRHRYSASAAAPGRFTEDGVPESYHASAWDESGVFYCKKTGPPPRFARRAPVRGPALFYSIIGSDLPLAASQMDLDSELSAFAPW